MNSSLNFLAQETHPTYIINWLHKYLLPYLAYHTNSRYATTVQIRQFDPSCQSHGTCLLWLNLERWSPTRLRWVNQVVPTTRIPSNPLCADTPDYHKFSIARKADGAVQDMLDSSNRPSTDWIASSFASLGRNLWQVCGLIGDTWSVTPAL